MKVVEGWIDLKIRDFFASSIPGDWGADGNPEDGIPVLRSTNFLNNGYIDYSDIAYRKVEKSRLDKRRISRDTILIEKSGGSPSQAAGRVVYCDRDFNGTASNFIEVVNVKDGFSSRYVAFFLYYLYQIGLVLKYQQQTTGIINFKLNEYSEETITCPASKSEQTKIAEVLSTVDRAIEQTEALIAKQQRIKTGLMQDLLTRGIDEHGNLRSEETHEFKDSPLGRIPVEWEVKPIEQKLEYIIDYRGRTPKKVVAGIPLLTAKNVRDGYLSDEPREFIAEENYNKWMTRGIPECGDVMFTTEAPMGNVTRVPDYKIALAQRVLTLSSKRSELTNEYLFWILHWSNSHERLEALTSGSTVVGIKQSVFRKVLFQFPKVDEQQEIAKTLYSHEKITVSEKRKLQKLRSLKTALMQDLLTGKKRVTALLNDTEVVHG